MLTLHDDDTGDENFWVNDDPSVLLDAGFADNIICEISMLDEDDEVVRMGLNREDVVKLRDELDSILSS